DRTSQTEQEKTGKESTKEENERKAEKRSKSKSVSQKDKRSKKDKSISKEGTIYNESSFGDVPRIPDSRDKTDDYVDKSETVKKGKTEEAKKSRNNPFSAHNRPN
ncbi:hypothetical protein PFISCL1PPCAC_18886, partial [Pristionchus fissidentatus]